MKTIYGKVNGVETARVVRPEMVADAVRRGWSTEPAAKEEAPKKRKKKGK